MKELLYNFLIGIDVLCVVLGAVCAIINFTNNKIMEGLVYVFCAACWIACTIICYYIYKEDR